MTAATIARVIAVLDRADLALADDLRREVGECEAALEEAQMCVSRVARNHRSPSERAIATATEMRIVGALRWLRGQR